MLDLKNIAPVPDAMDKSFRFTGDQWARDLHENLKLPGKFIKLLLNDTVLDPKKGIRMDILEVVELENGEYIIINIEHQSHVLDDAKLRIIYDYKVYSRCKYDLPVLTVVISPYPKYQHSNIYKQTESDILEPVFITIDETEINKRLNILNNNINNKNIKNSMVLDISLISIFVLKNRYKILKQLCLILKNAIGIKGKIKKDMTKVLSEMIKLKLQDSPRRVKELLNMLNEEIETTKRGIRIWYEEEFAQQRDEFQKELAQMEKQHIQELNQKTNELNQKEQEYVQELNQKEREHVRELNQKEDLITKQKRHIADLEAMLKIHGLF